METAWDRDAVMDEVGVSDSTMKHAAPNVEQYEFNLGAAKMLRCLTGKSTICGKCETCQFTLKMKDLREWFHRLGDFSRKKFMLGLLRRIHSVDLLRQLVSLLQPLLTKDHVYARARSQPSLETDVMTLSADRALQGEDVLNYITMTWDWFANASYWSKANFAFHVLQRCDAHLLHLLHAQARTLLVSEQKVHDAVAGRGAFAYIL
jgi:F-box/WD-40 domain protein 10